MEPDLRDEVVDFVMHWSSKTELPQNFFLKYLCLSSQKFCDWKQRYGSINRHNGHLPRNYWLTDEEQEKIVEFYQNNENDGYRRCAYMMIDQNIVAASPSAVYRTLAKAGVLRSRYTQKSFKGTGFQQPSKAHEHWHTDISYVKVNKVFYYLVCVLDGYSRSIVHWDIRRSMEDQDVHIVQQAAVEKFPEQTPRFITDRGSQFSGREFKGFIKQHGLSHVMTSPYYPQSNGKLERFHYSIKSECIRKKVPFDLEQAKRVVFEYIRYYNQVRLHSAIGYITPIDKLNGKEKQIFKLRDHRLEEARKQRRKINSYQLKSVS